MESTITTNKEAKVGKYTFTVRSATQAKDNREMRINAITNWLLEQWRKEQREVRYVG